MSFFMTLLCEFINSANAVHGTPLRAFTHIRRDEHELSTFHNILL